MKEHVRKALLDYGCRIAWLRESIGLTHDHLGERTGLDVKVVEEIERGELSATLEQLRQIAGGLRVNLSHLFDLHVPGGDVPEGFLHALIVANAVRVLGNLVVDASCLVLPPGVAVAVPRPSGLSWPDIVVVRDPPAAGHPSWLIREPLVIVEVMTEASELEDRSTKFHGYLKLGSLLDYVMVKTHEVGIEHYTRFEQGAWQLAALGAGARVQLQAVPGQLLVDDIYRGSGLEQ